MVSDDQTAYARLSVLQQMAAHGVGAQIKKTLCMIEPLARSSGSLKLRWETVTSGATLYPVSEAYREEHADEMGRAISGTSFSAEQVAAVEGMLADGTLEKGDAQTLWGNRISHITMSQTTAAQLKPAA
jgi:hypothetical protein